MKDSLFGFKDSIEREEFIIVVPVLLFFAWLGYYLLDGSSPDLAAGGTTAVVAVASDIDGDGVADSSDRCTTTAGTVTNFGCPATQSAGLLDSDGDGIANSLDKCPNTHGVMANDGCAADRTSLTSKTTNTDNIETTTDNTATDLTALDSDEDGVGDLQDQCPTLAGSADNAGCPPDADGDTIADAEDRCPALAGIADNLGCPADTDKDGVYDSADSCPDVAGISANSGCPADTDADGVSDAEDQCPDLPGPAVPGSTNNGCPPDADGDKVPDAADLCPEQPGTIDFNGCPAVTEPAPQADSQTNSNAVSQADSNADLDGDGVPNSADLCPARAGEARFQGCPPDLDADGVSDTDDRCPDVAGAIDNFGCPTVAADATEIGNNITNTDNAAGTILDSDNDGIADSVDQCPAIAGSGSDGCPVDSDGDGVADLDDQCVDVAGLVSLRGCAPDATADAEPVTPAISVADQRILDDAVAQVAFNSSSATLTTRSQEILREIADLMKKYPDSLLEISGHTDSSGNARRNMDLSMQRARACATFIASEGIAVDRLFAYGYGESQPITSNNTSDGRRINRRVEFELKFP